MTMRLSIISLAGIARTLVAVGTSSDADMFLTTAAAAPRSTCASSPSAFGVAGLASASLGLAGVTSVLAAGGCVTAGGACLLAGAGSAFGWAGSALAGPAPPWRGRHCLRRPSARARGLVRAARTGPTTVHRRRRSTRLRSIRVSSRPGTHANSGRPRRDPRGTCGTSPRPTTRSVRMVKLNCSRQLLASIPSVRQASDTDACPSVFLSACGYPHLRRLKASAFAQCPDAHKSANRPRRRHQPCGDGSTCIFCGQRGAVIRTPCGRSR